MNKYLHDYTLLINIYTLYLCYIIQHHYHINDTLLSLHYHTMYIHTSYIHTYTYTMYIHTIDIHVSYIIHTLYTCYIYIT